MRDAAADASCALSQTIAGNTVLTAMQARVDQAEPGYVELSIPARAAADNGFLAVGAIAALAEAASRLAFGGECETAEISLHLHCAGELDGAERLIARGEALREASNGRPVATAQADVFRVGADQGEALLATALVAVLTSR